MFRCILQRVKPSRKNGIKVSRVLLLFSDCETKLLTPVSEYQVFSLYFTDSDAKPPKPLKGRDLKKARRRRQEEQVAHSVFFGLIFYIIFVICVFSVSYGNRDQRAYRTKQHLDNLLYSANGDAPFPFESVSCLSHCQASVVGRAKNIH